MEESAGSLGHPQCNLFVHDGRRDFRDHTRKCELAEVENRIGFLEEPSGSCSVLLHDPTSAHEAGDSQPVRV